MQTFALLGEHRTRGTSCTRGTRVYMYDGRAALFAIKLIRKSRVVLLDGPCAVNNNAHALRVVNPESSTLRDESTQHTDRRVILPLRAEILFCRTFHLSFASHSRTLL
ncbi:uncharacterized protein LOC143188319 [Calliopsis andreniformis]|uniref:uncharacterized protein LOC143188319 n=1 Tax=Calliopsis andreniformis TaxID=337506 RepID=UPI003FCD4AFA